MDESRIAVIGGGPGGLYAARLIKRARPTAQVTVYEQNADGETFGFGVGLTLSTLRSLEQADPVTAAAIRRAAHSGHGMELRVGEGVRLAGGGNVAIGRAVLLEILREHAEDAGVRIEPRHVELPDLDADLVIAADGVRSGVREKLAGEFGARIKVDDALYLWAGTDVALEHATFEPVRTEHGVFVVHAYPYAPDRSTFLVETDEATWRRAGLDAADAEDGCSDERSLAYLSGVFTDVLNRHSLLGNRTRWQRFATVHCERWHHQNVVLLGDAAHTAHYSIGSGTKLALEDGIALARVLADTPSLADGLSEALERYESFRRPRVQRLQAIAARSHRWWKSFPHRLDLAPARLMTSFMTRAGNVTADRFAALHPDVVAQAAASLGSRTVTDTEAAEPVTLAEAVLNSPTGRFPRRVIDAQDIDSWAAMLAVHVDDVWGPGGAAVVERARVALEVGSQAVWLTGDGDRAQTLSRLDLAERVRLATGAVVGVDLPPSLTADAVGAVLAGRTDLVRFR